jgi:rare lipoprotein A
MKQIIKIIILSVFSFTMTACGFGTTYDGAPKYDVDVSHVQNATVKHETKSKYGNPSNYCVHGSCYHVLDNDEGYSQIGVASWYGTKFNGRLTSSREVYDMYKMTAAHKTLPIPTYARVTNLENHRHVIVKINDRGPFKKGRLIDLSYSAAKKLDVIKHGTALVKVEVVKPKDVQQEMRVPQTFRYATTAAVKPHSVRPKSQIKPTVKLYPEIYLQLGAYNNRAKAENVIQLASSVTNTPSHVYPAMYNNHMLYKVQLGPIKNAQDADQIEMDLDAIGLSEPKRIVR